VRTQYRSVLFALLVPVVSLVGVSAVVEAAQHQGSPAVKATPTGLDIRVESPEKALPAILESANRLDCQLEFIEYHRPRLDDVFIALTGHAAEPSADDDEAEKPKAAAGGERAA